MASAIDLVFPALFAGKSTETFTLLPNLPPELRDKIWEFMVPQNSVVKIYPAEGFRWRYRSSIDYPQDADFFGNTHYKTPAVLQICNESRRVGLKFLKMLPNFPPTYQSNVYFNYLTDTLRVMRDPTDTPIASADDDHRRATDKQLLLICFIGRYFSWYPDEAIRNLAVDTCTTYGSCNAYHPVRLAMAASEIPTLERCTLIHHGAHHLMPLEQQRVLRSASYFVDRLAANLNFDLNHVFLNPHIDSEFEQSIVARQLESNPAEEGNPNDEENAPVQTSGQTLAESMESRALDLLTLWEAMNRDGPSFALRQARFAMIVKAYCSIHLVLGDVGVI